MRWLGGSLLVFAALLWLGACARDTPASDTVPEQEEEEPLYAAEGQRVPQTPVERHI